MLWLVTLGMGGFLLLQPIGYGVRALECRLSTQGATDCIDEEILGEWGQKGAGVYELFLDAKTP